MDGAPNKYFSYFKYKVKKTGTWSAGNTLTVTDADVLANSCILIMPTSAHAGRWYVTVSDGSFIVTSSDAEDAGTTFTYEIL